MATPNKSTALVWAALAMCSVLVAAIAQAQGVSFIAHRDFATGVTINCCAYPDGRDG